jgi:hypothetical protein
LKRERSLLACGKEGKVLTFGNEEWMLAFAKGEKDVGVWEEREGCWCLERRNGCWSLEREGRMSAFGKGGKDVGMPSLRTLHLETSPSASQEPGDPDAEFCRDTPTYVGGGAGGTSTLGNEEWMLAWAASGWEARSHLEKDGTYETRSTGSIEVTVAATHSSIESQNFSSSKVRFGDGLQCIVVVCCLLFVVCCLLFCCLLFVVFARLHASLFDSSATQ